MSGSPQVFHTLNELPAPEAEVLCAGRDPWAPSPRSRNLSDETFRFAAGWALGLLAAGAWALSPGLGVLATALLERAR